MENEVVVNLELWSLIAAGLMLIIAAIGAGLSGAFSLLSRQLVVSQAQEEGLDPREVLAQRKADEKAAAGEHSGQPSSVLVFGLLTFLTLLEIGIATVPLLPSVIIAALLAMMALKAFLVAAYYMHLAKDPRYLTYVFIIVIPFVALILAALLIEYVT
ncbi:MAG: cytochrome C oxidase subunit IV family protein [Chloroflexi bacterium]|nr:cytochrome C oxidase subunit IV family protein [Chloroflexota bacterium]